mgnify:CR=1 FL=1
MCEVRLNSLKTVPRILLKIPPEDPDFLYKRLVESTIARVRDVEDEIVQLSIDILAHLATSNKNKFVDTVAELGGIHANLVEYYSAHIFSEDRNWTPRIHLDSTISNKSYADVVVADSLESSANSDSWSPPQQQKQKQAQIQIPSKIPIPNPTPTPTKISDKLTFGFVPPNLIKILQNKLNSNISKADALNQIQNKFKMLDAGNLDALSHFLPLFLDLVIQLTDDTEKSTTVSASLSLLELMAEKSPKVFEISLDIIMPFLTTKLGHENGEIRQSSYYVIYTLIKNLGSSCMLPQISNFSGSSSRSSSSSSVVRQENCCKLVIVAILLTNKQQLDFDSARLLQDIGPILNSPNFELKTAAMETAGEQQAKRANHKEYV